MTFAVGDRLLGTRGGQWRVVSIIGAHGLDRRIRVRNVMTGRTRVYPQINLEHLIDWYRLYTHVHYPTAVRLPVGL